MPICQGAACLKLLAETALRTEGHPVGCGGRLEAVAHEEVQVTCRQHVSSGQRPCHIGSDS